MKKTIVIMCLLLFLMPLAASAYNLTVEAQFLDPSSGNPYTGSHNFNFTLYNSTDDVVFNENFTQTLDSNGRLYKQFSVSYAFSDGPPSVTWKVDSDNETDKVNIGYIPNAINSEFLGGQNPSYYLDDTVWSLTGNYIINNSGSLDFNETFLNSTINNVISSSNISSSNSSTYWGDFLEASDLNYLILSDWNNITNKPAGFADDVDNDTQLTESQVDSFVSNNGYFDNSTYPNMDTDSTDDLTTSTNFAGDVSGVYNNIQIGANVIGDGEINYSQITLNDFTNDANFTSLTTYPNLDLDSTDDFNGSWSALTDTPAGFADDVDNDTTYNFVCSAGDFVNNLTSDGGYTCGTPAGGGDITSVQGDQYIYNGSDSGAVVLAFNETKLNATINSINSQSGFVSNGSSVSFSNIESDDWTNVTITESQISDLSHTVDTNTNCSVDGSCPLISYDSELSSASVNSSAYWDNLDSPSDITGLVNSQISSDIAANYSKLVDKPANIDEDSTDDLTTSTNFAGDVSGLYNNIQLGSDVVGDAEINYSQITLSDFTNDAGFLANGSDANFNILLSNDWTNVTITESQISDLSHTVDTNTNCSVDNSCPTIVYASNITGWDTDSSDDLTTSTNFAGDVSGTYNTISVSDDSHLHNAANITAGTFGTGDFVMDGKLQVQNLTLENDPTNHEIYDNSSCVFIKGDTATLVIC